MGQPVLSTIEGRPCPTTREAACRTLPLPDEGDEDDDDDVDDDDDDDDADDEMRYRPDFFNILGGDRALLQRFLMMMAVMAFMIVLLMILWTSMKV